MNIDI